MSQLGHNLVNYQCLNLDTIFNSFDLNKDMISLCSNQGGVSISTTVFEVYMSQVKVNRHNYNSYVVIYIYHMINTIMLHIYSIVIKVVIKMYVITYIKWLS